MYYITYSGVHLDSDPRGGQDKYLIKRMSAPLCPLNEPLILYYLQYTTVNSDLYEAKDESIVRGTIFR